MTKILGISGSLRSGSFNTMLLNQAAGSVPEGVRFEIGSIRDIPLYNGDIEAASGLPATAQALKNQVVDCDGLLLVTPEYNNSIPGVFKNAIDWLTRPPADVRRVFAERRVALLGASPGGFGTTLSQVAWLPVLRTLGMQPWFGAKLLVSNAKKVFDDRGTMTDAAMTGQLQQFLQGFVQFVR